MVKSNPAVYGTGLIALDIVISSNPNEPTYHWAGGTCGNVLTILSYLGWASFPIGRLNNEPSSLRAKEDMRRWGVRLDFCEMIPTASVPVITQEITTDKYGSPTHRFHWRNCPKCGSWLPSYKAVTLNATRVIKEGATSGNVFFFDRLSPGALDLARHFKSLGSVIFFEPSAKADPKHLEEAVRLADIVKYSDQRFKEVITDDIKDHRPFLEIQTMGANGLRYRLKKEKFWNQLPAFPVSKTIDTCGCGDWTTAGIIAKLCRAGKKELISNSSESIKRALRYGQALGSWNCGFEGARSGMYRISKQAFNRAIDSILHNGTYNSRKSANQLNSNYIGNGLCPACPH